MYLLVESLNYRASCTFVNKQHIRQTTIKFRSIVNVLNVVLLAVFVLYLLNLDKKCRVFRPFRCFYGCLLLGSVVSISGSYGKKS